MLCLGLDIDPKKVPSALSGSARGLFEFTRNIIEATSDIVAAYKPNLAFFESMGVEGYSLLRWICDRIPDESVVILDAKRGDIENTSAQYATALFKTLNADWVTVNPYMGYDSLRPFLEYQDRGVFILCLTSNKGSEDFQTLDCGGQPLYMHVLDKAVKWNTNGNIGLVVGATHPDHLVTIRERSNNMPLLIPGIGAQGGALERAVVDGTANFTKTALLNVSRSALYASSGANYAEAARKKLESLRDRINSLNPAGRHTTPDKIDPASETTQVMTSTPSASPAPSAPHGSSPQGA